MGIDLGTTNSCISLYADDRAEIIPNSDGARTTPSIVSYCGDQCLVGVQAKEQLESNANNTIYGVKRFIGLTMREVLSKEVLEKFPFVVRRSFEDQPQFAVQFEGVEKLLTPVEISAEILRKLKQDAESYFSDQNFEVVDVVITVPAYFNNIQRAATKAAAKLAGLHVLSLINEPTAAAIAYGLDEGRPLGEDPSERRNVLVFNLGEYFLKIIFQS